MRPGKNCSKSLAIRGDLSGRFECPVGARLRIKYLDSVAAECLWPESHKNAPLTAANDENTGLSQRRIRRHFHGRSGRKAFPAAISGAKQVRGRLKVSNPFIGETETRTETVCRICIARTDVHACVAQERLQDTVRIFSDFEIPEFSLNFFAHGPDPCGKNGKSLYGFAVPVRGIQLSSIEWHECVRQFPIAGSH